MDRNFSKHLEIYNFISVLIFLSSYYLLSEAKAQVFYVLSLIGLIAAIIVKKGRIIRVDSFFILLICFLSYFSISTLWSSEPGEYLSKTIRHSVYIVIGLVIFSLAFKDKISLKLNILLITIIVSALLSFVLTALVTPYQFYDSSRLTHMSLLGLTANPIHTGVYFGTASLALLYYFRISKKASISSISLIFALILLVFVFLTKSRGAILFYFIALLFMTITVKIDDKRRDYLLLGLFVIGGALIYLFFISTVVDRLEQPNYRLQLLSASWKVIQQNVWFGTGLNHNDFLVLPSGEIFTKVHNSFVHSLQVGGLVGLIITMLVVSKIIHIGYKAENDLIKFVTTWLIYGSLVLSIDGDILVDRPSREWFCFWIPLFIVAAYHYRRIDTKND